MLIYGEIHGVVENAYAIYTLIHNLGIKHVAIENSTSIKEFIDTASKGIYDFNLIDSATFDTSILSIELAKTLAVLKAEGAISTISYIDNYFDNLEQNSRNVSSSPQERERLLAQNILSLDKEELTICLLGQWHTRPDLVSAGGVMHKSALYRIR